MWSYPADWNPDPDDDDWDDLLNDLDDREEHDEHDEPNAHRGDCGCPACDPDNDG